MLFMEKKDEAVILQLADVLLSCTYGSICISRGSTYSFLLQYLEIWSFSTLHTNAHGQTVMKRIQSTKKVFRYIAHSMRIVL